MALLALVAAIYWPGLHGGFFFDDGPNILEAQGVRLKTLSPGSIDEALRSGTASPSGRPVSQLSFALNYYFTRFDPFAFKLTNLAVHLLNGVLVFFLALALLRLGSGSAPGRGPPLAAGVIAALWLLCPIQVTSVLYIVQRMTSLAALFLFAAVLLHVHARETGGRRGAVELVAAWAILWPLSFFSKETGVLLPLFVLAYELIVRWNVRGELDRFARVFTALVTLAVVAGTVYVISPAGRWLWAAYGLRTFSPIERLLTEGRVLWFYLGLVFFPRFGAFGLYHDDIPVSTGLVTPWTTLPALLGILGLVWIVWGTRKRAPLVAFGIAWFLIGHGLESTILPLEIAHEYRNYVPLFGLALATVQAATPLFSRAGPPRTLGAALLVVALAYPALVTALRAHEYGQELRRTQIEAHYHPRSARAQYEAGRALAKLLAESATPDPSIYARARRHYERAGANDPVFKLGFVGLMNLNCLTGKEPEPAWTRELSQRLRRTPFAPGDRNLMYSLKEMSASHTLCLRRTGVERLFAAALSNPTVSPGVARMLHSWNADYLALTEHDFPAAQAELDRALAIAPNNPGDRLKRAELALLQGRRGEARQILNRLQNVKLASSDRTTFEQLNACLETDNAAAQCIGR